MVACGTVNDMTMRRPHDGTPFFFPTFSKPTLQNQVEGAVIFVHVDSTVAIRFR